MNFHNRIFPYPVYGLDPLVGHKASMKVEARVNEITLTATHAAQSPLMAQMIKDGDAILCTQIICNATFYRESFTTKKALQQIPIKSEALSGIVDVYFIICAKRDISGYDITPFGPEYSGAQIDLVKGDVLSYAGQARFIANKTPDELSAVSAFMRINSSNKKSGFMYNEYEDDRITIYLSEEDYGHYQTIAGDDELATTLHSTIVLPALAETIRVFREDPKEYSQYKWNVIIEQLSEKFNDESPLVVAQKILELPINRSFKSIDSWLN